MSGEQYKLFQAAKKVIRRDPSLSDEAVGEACGLSRHVVAGWTDGTPDKMTIASARREVAGETVTRTDHGGGSGWVPTL